LPGYIGGNKYLGEMGMFDIQGQFGEKAEDRKGPHRGADKGAAPCSLATYKFPSGDQFKYA